MMMIQLIKGYIWSKWNSW